MVSTAKVLVLMLLGAAAVVLGAASVVLAIRLFSGRKRAAGGPMSCGACGYQVQGLQSMSCPECGADLREVGIVPLDTGRGWSTPVVLIVIAVVMLVLAVLYLTA